MPIKPLSASVAAALLLTLASDSYASAALKPRLLEPKPLYASVARSGASTDVIYLKLREGTSTSLSANAFAGNALSEVNRILATAPGSKPERLFTRPDVQLRAEKQAGEARLGVEMADMTLFYVIRLPKNLPAFQVEGLLNALNRLQVVELAYIKPPSAPARADIDPPTGNRYNHQELQFGAAPGGIEAEYAWTIPGGRGAGTRYIDIEQGFRNTHEDLKDPFFIHGPYASATDDAIQHGVNSVGLITAQHNAFGMKGIAPDAGFGFITVAPGVMSIPQAIDLASSHLSPGDVILIEQQYGDGPHPGQASCGCSSPKCGNVPVETYPDDFAAIVNATAAGRIVVEAAGNGSVNLDHAYFGNKFNRAVRDSGAILVGATGQSDNVQECFTNHGSRIDVNAAGSGVGTTGSAGLYFGMHIDEWYTNNFRGTSAASPFVAGSALALQGIQKSRAGVGFTPATMRTLLRQYGTPQQPPHPSDPFRPVGTKPNLRSTLNWMLANSDGDRLSNGDELALNCTLNAWTSVNGTVQTGTPYDSLDDATAIRRLSEPCALRTSTIGSYVTDASPNALAEFSSRYYFRASQAPSAPITIFRAETTSGAVLYYARLTATGIEVRDTSGNLLASTPARATGWNSVELRWKAGIAGEPDSRGWLAVDIGYAEFVSGKWTNQVHRFVDKRVGTSSDRIDLVRVGQIAGTTPVTMDIDTYEKGTSYSDDIGRKVRGDSTGDGTCNSDDVTALANEVLFSLNGTGGIAKGQPDCTEDGLVNSDDMTCLAKRIEDDILNGIPCD